MKSYYRSIMTIITKRVLICFMIIFVFLPSVAHAQDASVMLKMYGIDTTSSVAVEEKKLSLVEDEYYKEAQVVNTNTMVGLASDVLDEYSKQKLSDMDKEIAGLSNKLDALEIKTGDSKNSSVDTLLDLDTEYRSTQSLLEKKVSDRDDWLSQSSANTSIKEPTDVSDKQKLLDLDYKVQHQKAVYMKAISYPELGDISNFKSPLSIPVLMTSPFGVRINPLDGSEMEFHKGMDLHAPKDTEVLAAFDGTVFEASSNTELGNYVLIDHGAGIKTLYGHLTSYSVKAGDKVKQYQLIARSGNTGSSTTGPHLHFGVFINGKAVDPAVLVKH